MALLDELNALQTQLGTIIAGVEATTVDPATGLPAGAPPGQHDVVPAAAPAPPPDEAADVAEDAAETPAAPVAPDPAVPAAPADPSAGL